MKYHRSALTIFSLLLCATLVLSGCVPFQLGEQTVEPEQGNNTQVTFNQTATSSATGDGVVTQTQTASIITPELIVLTAPVDGQTALELLSENTKVITKSFGEAGEFVETINGKMGNADNYWAFYVNDKYATQAANTTILSKGDIVKFAYQSVDDASVMDQ